MSNHQPDDNSNYYDDDDLITFQFESNRINFYYTQLSRYSKFIRNKYLPSDVTNLFPHDLQDFKEQQHVTTENIILFFKLLQDDFNINQNLTYGEYKDLFKLSQFLQVRRLSTSLNQYVTSQNDVTDFQIQIILHEVENVNDNYTNSSPFQINQTIEELLSGKIVECLQNENFSKIPISIVYRIIDKSDKIQIKSDLLYDFIKKDLKTFHVLFIFLDLEQLSEDRFEELFEIYSDSNGQGQLYMKYLPCNLSFIMKLKNNKKNAQKQIEDELSQTKQILDDTKNELSQTKQLFDDTKNELSQTKQLLNDTKNELSQMNNVVLQQKDEIQRLKQENEDKYKKIKDTEQVLANKVKEHEKYIDESIRLYDKGDYNKVNITSNKMTEDQKNHVIKLTRESLNMHKNYFECAKYIKGKLDNKYGGYWCVTLHARNYGNCFMDFFDNCYINFTIGEFNVCIFKASLGSESIRLHDKGDYNKVNILENKMTEDQKNYVMKLTRESLNMHKNHFECAKYIKDNLETKYGGKWCVFLHARNYGDGNFFYYNNCCIRFESGEYLISIFKSSIY